MSEQNQHTLAPENPGENKSGNPLFQLLADLKSDVGINSISEVTQLVRKTAKEKIIPKRAEQLAAALEAYIALDRAHKSIKPDSVIISEGGVKSQVWSKPQLEAQAKAKKALDEAQKNILLALEQNDFSKLGNVKPPTNKPAEPETDEAKANGSAS